MRGFSNTACKWKFKSQEINRILELVDWLTVKNVIKKTIVGISDLFRYLDT